MVARVRTSLLLAALALGTCGCGDDSRAAPATGASEAPASTYICPMRCVVEGETEPHTQAEPGACPVCGMDLVPQP